MRSLQEKSLERSGQRKLFEAFGSNGAVTRRESFDDLARQMQEVLPALPQSHQQWMTTVGHITVGWHKVNGLRLPNTRLKKR